MPYIYVTTKEVKVFDFVAKDLAQDIANTIESPIEYFYFIHVSNSVVSNTKEITNEVILHFNGFARDEEKYSLLANMLQEKVNAKFGMNVTIWFNEIQPGKFFEAGIKY